MCDKHYHIAKNGDYQTRLEHEKSNTSFEQELENAIDDANQRRCDRVGLDSVIIAQLKDAGHENDQFYASTTKIKYVKIDEDLISTLLNRYECISNRTLIDAHLEGYFQYGKDEVTMLSNLLFSVFMRYLLDVRLKAESSIGLLKLEKRGKYLKAGIIQLCLTTIYFRKSDGVAVNYHDLYLLIDFNDGTYCVTDEANRWLSINQDVEIDFQNEQYYSQERSDPGITMSGM